MPTIAQAINEAARVLRDAGVSDERLTANLLMCYALGVERAQLLIRANEEPDEPGYRAFLEAVRRRAAGEPLQYITGYQEFYGLEFKVTPAVLIPRPETEFLVEQIIKLSQAKPEIVEPFIVDVGTGSGCIAITLARHIPGARVVAIDISRAALEVARENATRHGVADQIEFLEGDLLAPLDGRGLEGSVDFLASNPPYVPLTDAATMQREVRDWEPMGALFAGNDGLSFYKRLLEEGRAYIKPGGYLVCEIGYGQLDAIRQMIAASDWRLETVTDDLQGIPRTLAVRKVS